MTYWRKDRKTKPLKSPADLPTDLPPRARPTQERFRKKPPELPPIQPRGEPLKIPTRTVKVERTPGMTNHQYRRLRKLAKIRAARRIEALRLYEPLPIQEAFHKSPAKRRIIRAGNRGGKTLMAAVEVAMAATHCHPVESRYPKYFGRCYIVAKDNRAIGETLYPKLFKAGAFKIIRDKETGRWRAFRPWTPEDAARVSEAKPAPPLIPPRFIKSIAWENKKESVPRKVILHNGWELSFFTSNGKPPRGMDLDLIHFDEEITDPDWLPEMMARLLDRKGRFIWSATPQSGTDQFMSLSERAEAEAHHKHPLVEEFKFRTADNPHFDKEDRDTLAADLSEEEIAVRLEGEFAVLGFLMYPEFSMHTHGIDLKSDENKELFPGGQIPDTWSRYAAIDPGNQVCAVLFAAVPPPSVGDFVYFYDELYIRRCDVDKFGDEMQKRCAGQNFEAFIIDDRGSRRSEMIGKTIRQQFSEALKKRGVASVRTKHGFVLGSDDILGRCSVFRSWLRIRNDGTTKLRVVKGRLPAFEHEIKYYRRKKVRVNGEDQILDEPDQRRRNHLMDCAGYIAHAKCVKYVKPTPAAKKKSAAVRYLEQKRNRRREKNADEGSYVMFGAGSAA